MSSNLHKIQHALSSIDQIFEYADGYDLNSFINDRKTSDAVLIHFVNLGERLTGLTDDFKESFTNLPYAKARAMRNFISHQYDSVDQSVVWKTIQEDLPKIKSTLLSINEELSL